MPLPADECNPDFRDLFAVFNAEGVRYLVIGGYAFAFHRRPRTTKDIDIWVEPTEANAAKVLRALRRFGAPEEHFTQEDFQARGTVLHIGVAPNRIDLLTDPAGLSFEEAWRERLDDFYGNEPVHVIGREHFIRSKRAAGRRQDLLDIALLEKARPTKKSAARKRKERPK